MENKIILTSRGLNSKDGRNAIRRSLKTCIGENYKPYLCDKTIMLATIEEYGINQLLKDVAIEFGFCEENIIIWDEYVSKDIIESKKLYDFCYVSEGNTFQIAQMLRLTMGDEIIRNSVGAGGFYIGASAGAMLTTSSIEFAGDWDKNFVHLQDLNGMDLLPQSLGKVTIIPHYTKQQFERWKRNTPNYKLEEYDDIYYVSNTQARIYDVDIAKLKRPIAY